MDEREQTPKLVTNLPPLAWPMLLVGMWMSQPFFSGKPPGNTRRAVNEFIPFHLVIPLPGIDLKEISREVHKNVYVSSSITALFAF